MSVLCSTAEWSCGLRDFDIATCSDDLFLKLWNIPDDYKIFATLRGHEHSISRVSSYQETIRSFHPVGFIQSVCGCPNKVCYAAPPLFLINLLIEIIV